MKKILARLLGFNKDIETLHHEYELKLSKIQQEHNDLLKGFSELNKEFEEKRLEAGLLSYFLDSLKKGSGLLNNQRERKKIILIEDDVSTREWYQNIIQDLIDEHDIQFDVTDNYNEAVFYLLNNTYDLIISDFCLLEGDLRLFYELMPTENLWIISAHPENSKYRAEYWLGKMFSDRRQLEYMINEKLGL